MEDFLTPAEVAKQLGVTVSTVRRWLRSGYLPALKVGPRAWRISKADLSAHIEQAKNRK